MKKLDSITLTSIAAEKAGMSYGKYVAMFGSVHEEEVEEFIPPEGARICPECGKAFTGRKGCAVYCSNECQVKRNGRRYIQKYRERRGEMLRMAARVCVVCGKPIPESRNIRAKTCSYECGMENEKIINCNRERKKREAKKAMEVEAC